MGMLTRAKKRRLEEEEKLVDRISRLPDAILGDIVSLLPTKDGGRTQVLSSRWRHIWRSAPLNIDLLHCRLRHRLDFDAISGVLSSHQGPGRRLSIPFYCGKPADLEGWLRSPALNNLQELEFDHAPWHMERTPPLLTSARRFSGTLRIASFGCCSFPDGDDAVMLRFPVLEQLSLRNVEISESSLHAVLAGCPDLQSLLLDRNHGCPRVEIVSPTIRSIGARRGYCSSDGLQQLIIKDAPCLERLLLSRGLSMDISVVSAPRLGFLGQLSEAFPRIQIGNLVFEGSHIVSLMMVVRSVKVLALAHTNISMDVVIDFMKCFPCVEKLYIKVGEKSSGCHKYRNLISTLDIHEKKIVLTNYLGNRKNANFAKFFVLHARLLESMTLQLEQLGNISSAWIGRQNRLLLIKKRASRSACFDFVSRNIPGQPCHISARQVQDLSTVDPFVRFHHWV